MLARHRSSTLYNHFAAWTLQKPAGFVAPRLASTPLIVPGNEAGSLQSMPTPAGLRSMKGSPSHPSASADRPDRVDPLWVKTNGSERGISNCLSQTRRAALAHLRWPAVCWEGNRPSAPSSSRCRRTLMKYSPRDAPLPSLFIRQVLWPVARQATGFHICYFRSFPTERVTFWRFG